MKKNKNYIKILFLSLISFSAILSIYHLNTSDEDEAENESSYLKSEICYYALNGIIADHHYHLQLNITIDDERISVEDLVRIADTAGRFEGLGTWRPRYGRFGAVLNEIEA